MDGFLKSDFVIAIDFIVNTLTLIGMLAGVRWALVRRYDNLIAYKIVLYLQYCVRASFFIILFNVLYYFGVLIYQIIYFYIFGGGFNTKGDLDISNVFIHLLSGFISITICSSILLTLGSFIWTSSWDLTRSYINAFLPQRMALIKKLEKLEIIEAFYGADERVIDVTEITKKLVHENKLEIQVKNSMFGDPCVGTPKKLVIKYKLGNGVFQKEIEENKTVLIPD